MFNGGLDLPELDAVMIRRRRAVDAAAEDPTSS